MPTVRALVRFAARDQDDPVSLCLDQCSKLFSDAIAVDKDKPVARAGWRGRFRGWRFRSDSPRVTRMIPSPSALISAPSFSPTPLLSTKISQLPGLAGADGSGAGGSFERSLGCHWNS